MVNSLVVKAADYGTIFPKGGSLLWEAVVCWCPFIGETMNQATYLDRMGIERWNLREKPQILVSLQHVYSFFLGPSAQPRGLLLFDAGCQTVAEQALVEAMVKAMQQPYEGGYQEAFLFSPILPSVVVALGPRAAAYALHQPGLQDKVMVSRAVSDLLQQPALKSQAWKDLQNAMRRMA